MSHKGTTHLNSAVVSSEIVVGASGLGPRSSGRGDKQAHRVESVRYLRTARKCFILAGLGLTSTV
eukprot:93300-Amphidinium_carterae.1